MRPLADDVQGVTYAFVPTGEGAAGFASFFPIASVNGVVEISGVLWGRRVRTVQHARVEPRRHGYRTGRTHPHQEATVVSDHQSQVPNTSDEQEHPTVNKPLNGPERSRVKPLLLLVAFVATLALIYWIGVTFLVPAD